MSGVIDSIRIHLPLSRLEPPTMGHVDVWLVDLSASNFTTEVASTSSQAKGWHGRKQQGFRLQSRFFTRLLLAQYMGMPGKDLRLSTNENGKPFIDAAPITFNVSHSRQWLAVAIASMGEVGVDIEIARPIRRAHSLAKRYFSATEAAVLAGLSEPERSHQFLRRWTLTEALVKANGDSLAKSLSFLGFDETSEQLLSRPPHWSSDVQWAFRHFDGSQDTSSLIGCVVSSNPMQAIHLKWLSAHLPINCP